MLLIQYSKKGSVGKRNGPSSASVIPVPASIQRTCPTFLSAITGAGTPRQSVGTERGWVSLSLVSLQRPTAAPSSWKANWDRERAFASGYPPDKLQWNHMRREIRN